MFVNFLNVLTTKAQPPFGIAQLGRAFRNEINHRTSSSATREFELMELEFFVPPQTARVGHQYGATNGCLYTRYGITSEKLAPPAE